MKKFCWVLIFILLSACGFKLRQPIALAAPLEQMYLQTVTPYSPFTHELRSYLKFAGVKFVDDPTLTKTILDIVSETETQKLLSVSGTQQTRQYNLIINLKFRILSKTGAVIIDNQEITETRTITILANQMLGGGNEATSLFQQMRQAILFDLTNRLASDGVTHELKKHKL